MHEKGERGHEADREKDDGQPHALERGVADADQERGHGPARECDEVATVAELDETHDDQRDGEARNHRGERRRAATAQRRKRDPIESDPKQAAGDDREGDRDVPRQAERADRKERGERAEHEHRRMREIQDVEDAEHEREADGEQRVDRADEYGVIELLEH